MSISTKTQIWQMGAMEIARAIRKKEISCEETIRAHLERIEAINPTINAITVVLQESALQAAKDADKRLATEETPPPLLGVPMTIKENIDCVGSATTFGVQVLREAHPQDDAPHVKNLKGAGAIAIGIPGWPEFAFCTASADKNLTVWMQSSSIFDRPGFFIVISRIAISPYLRKFFISTVWLWFCRCA